MVSIDIDLAGFDAKNLILPLISAETIRLSLKFYLLLCCQFVCLVCKNPDCLFFSKNSVIFKPLNRWLLLNTYEVKRRCLIRKSISVN